VSTWKPAGVNGQPSAKQLAARHQQREAPANVPAPRPGLPLGGVSGPSGVRIAVNSGDWRERVRGKRNWSQEL
jgi:hypothetical protein